MDAYIYDNRVNQLKSFLKKPLTLIVGIMFCLSALITSSTAVLDYINSFYSFDIESYNFFANIVVFFISLFAGLLNILPAISFFLLYFKSRKPSINTNYSTPATIMTIFSIISIILTLGICAFFIVCLCFAIILPFFIFAAIAIVTIILVAVPPILLYLSSLMLAARSVVKSCKTVYIRKWQMIF